MPPRVRTKTASAKTQTAKSTSSHRKSSTSVVVPPHPYLSGNALVCGDNLDKLKELPDGCIDLIYLDPPFNSNQFYVAAFGNKGTVEKQLKDIWRWTVESENSFQRLPHGKLLDCLRGIRLQAGGSIPYGGLLCLHGTALGTDPQSPKANRQCLSPLRPSCQRIPANPDGCCVWNL